MPPSDLHAPILDPRLAPRYQVRCLVRASAGRAPFATETEDLGPLGCQLTAPGPLPEGLPLRLHLAWPSVPEELHVTGEIAWANPAAPFRHGVAFAPCSLPAARRWVDRLVAIHPELAEAPRPPVHLGPEARLHLGEPPRFLLDFTSAELAVLRVVREGVTTAELRRRLGATWEDSLRALLSLLARRVVTSDPAAAAHPLAWADPLGDLALSGPVARPPCGLGHPPAALAPPRLPAASPRLAPPQVRGAPGLTRRPAPLARLKVRAATPVDG